MDGLKYINDTFGHKEGDFGIRLISEVVSNMADQEEICVRAGGDEFYLIGIGQYDEDAPQRKIDLCNCILSDKAAKIKKPYSITASIGAVVGKVKGSTDFDDILLKADEKCISTNS